MTTQSEQLQEALEQRNAEIEKQLIEWLQERLDHMVEQPYTKVLRLDPHERWDTSGYVVDDWDAWSPRIETVEDLLGQYTGEWEATYTSGHGRNWKTYGCALVERIRDLVWASVPDEPTDECYETAITWEGDLYDWAKGLEIVAGVLR